ncbi:MAG: tRNA 2-thiouridine(34) synthase MnmA [Thermodesulfobacteriota bacterium]
MIAVLVSGGIDSLVAAHLLKQSGADVTAIHFLTGYEEIQPGRLTDLFARMDIPLALFDCRADFKARVVDDFVGAYLRGETPNPCMICNSRIKFGACLDYALAMGADAIATGHYCRVSVDADGARLWRGADPAKEQSYFLAFLSQVQLDRSRFPLDRMTKADVRVYAGRYGLAPLSRKESQDVCFIGGRECADFIEDHAGIKNSPGPIEDMAGRVIGEHSGLYRFTIGQRRGINCPAKRPYHVAAIDTARNCLKVGFREELFVPRCRVERINWIPRRPQGPVNVSVKIRYNQTAVPARVIPLDEDAATVEFFSPQFAVTPGQGAVFYDGDAVLGGGVIKADKKT